jgi:glycosyltransferase involved in cell wall biosynthesis
MLSILIPTYNFNVYPTAKEIVKQCYELDVVFELICFDDCSKSILNRKNEKINNLKNSTFIAQSNNAGYTENRNNLAAEAKYEFLLFLDGDSIIIRNNFIKKYLDCINPQVDVIYGGRVHPIFIHDENKILRWKYGKYKEYKSPQVRSKSPYKTLMFHNTLIKKSCFDQIKFDTEITSYGHDDTVLAFQISLKKLNVKHIDNPIEHGDIDNNLEFINKTENAVRNLLTLHHKNKIDVSFVSLLTYFDILKKLNLKRFMGFNFRLFQTLIKKQLQSKNSSLFLFNYYKLVYMCYLDSKNNN